MATPPPASYFGTIPASSTRGNPPTRRARRSGTLFSRGSLRGVPRPAPPPSPPPESNPSASQSRTIRTTEVVHHHGDATTALTANGPDEYVMRFQCDGPCSFSFTVPRISEQQHREEPEAEPEPAATSTDLTPVPAQVIASPEPHVTLRHGTWVGRDRAGKSLLMGWVDPGQVGQMMNSGEMVMIGRPRAWDPAEDGLLHWSRKDFECAVCLDLFDDPRTIECGHSFCSGCLTGLGYVERCPICRRIFRDHCPNWFLKEAVAKWRTEKIG